MLSRDLKDRNKEQAYGSENTVWLSDGLLRIDLNCDMGEGMPDDEALMPFISSANIACGFHAGDESMMRRTVQLALTHKVAIGAHPSYPDRENFGRLDLLDPARTPYIDPASTSCKDPVSAPQPPADPARTPYIDPASTSYKDPVSAPQPPADPASAQTPTPTAQPPLSPPPPSTPQLTAEDLPALITTQLAALQKICIECGARLHHVKLHGALYNRAARDTKLSTLICKAIAIFDPSLFLYGPGGSAMEEAAAHSGLPFVKEAFADRTYRDDGSLTPRTEPHALIADTARAIAQVLKIIRDGKVRTADDKEITLTAQTICIHGDGNHAVPFAQAIHATLGQNLITVQSP